MASEASTTTPFNIVPEYKTCLPFHLATYFFNWAIITSNQQCNSPTVRPRSRNTLLCLAQNPIATIFSRLNLTTLFTWKIMIIRFAKWFNPLPCNFHYFNIKYLQCYSWTSFMIQNFINPLSFCWGRSG